jgi:hypothetical protein
MIGDLTTQLRDIQDLDPIGWWPPAIGWWLVAAAALLALYLLFRLLVSLLRDPPGSWRREARSLLQDLRRRQRNQPPKQTAAELSELLRRITIARFGRDHCAALAGEEWLEWLREKDPNHFDWPQYRELLTQLPYAPVQAGSQTPELERLIKAAQQMVAASREDAARKRLPVEEG